jgi:hypothetical protein
MLDIFTNASIEIVSGGIRTSPLLPTLSFVDLISPIDWPRPVVRVVARRKTKMVSYWCGAVDGGNVDGVVINSV